MLLFLCLVSFELPSLRLFHSHHTLPLYPCTWGFPYGLLLLSGGEFQGECFRGGSWWVTQRPLRAKIGSSKGGVSESWHLQPWSV